MADSSETAYITGGASGLGKAVAELLVKKGIKVFLADRDTEGAERVADSLNKSAGFHIAFSGTVDTANWDSQVKAFGKALSQFGNRIDHVYAIAGIGERRWLPKTDPQQQTSQSGFEKPDLSVLDIDLNGYLYTFALAVQQFRRQDVGRNGFRGKMACVASVCGIYFTPTLPIYTAAKHGVAGFVGSYGRYIVQEKMTLNAVAPHVVRTNISLPVFYDKLDSMGLLTPIQGVVDAFESILDGKEKDASGEIFEVGPNYGKDGQGAVPRAPQEFLDAETKQVVDLLEIRALPLQVPH